MINENEYAHTVHIIMIFIYIYHIMEVMFSPEIFKLY